MLFCIQIHLQTKAVQKPGSLFWAAPAPSPCVRALSLGSYCCVQRGPAPGTSESNALTTHLTQSARHPPGAWHAQTHELWGFCEVLIIMHHNRRVVKCRTSSACSEEGYGTLTPALGTMNPHVPLLRTTSWPSPLVSPAPLCELLSVPP